MCFCTISSTSLCCSVQIQIMSIRVHTFIKLLLLVALFMCRILILHSSTHLHTKQRTDSCTKGLKQTKDFDFHSFEVECTSKYITLYFTYSLKVKFPYHGVIKFPVRSTDPCNKFRNFGNLKNNGLIDLPKLNIQFTWFLH